MRLSASLELASALDNTWSFLTSWDGQLSLHKTSRKKIETGSGQVVRSSQINTEKEERERKEVRGDWVWEKLWKKYRQGECLGRLAKGNRGRNQRFSLSIGRVKGHIKVREEWLKGKRTLKRKRVEKVGLEGFPSETRRLNEEAKL